MTNQEAIEHLKNISIYSYQDGYTDEARTALDMAIEALKANGTDINVGSTDAISRQAAIDAILGLTNCLSVRELYEYIQEHQLTNTWIDGINDAIDAVIWVSSAQSETTRGEWEIYEISPFDGEGCRCSECRFEGVPYWSFCPNCGADMRGGGDG